MALGLRGTTLFLDANLTAYYEFESGALTTDSKGSATLTNLNTVTSNASGKFNGDADNSTASNKGFSVANAWGLTPTTNFTFSTWVKMNAEISSGTQYLFSWQYGPSNNDVDVNLFYDFNGGTRRLSFQRNRNGVATDQFNSNQTLGTSTYHHVAMTWDGSTLTGYVDGASVGTVASSGTGNASVVTPNSHISTDTGGANGLQAKYDDFAVFSRALSGAEITTLFNSPTASASTGGGSFLLNFI